MASCASAEARLQAVSAAAKASRPDSAATRLGPRTCARPAPWTTKRIRCRYARRAWPVGPNRRGRPSAGASGKRGRSSPVSSQQPVDVFSENFLAGSSDPDDLAVAEAARLVALGQQPLIQFVIDDKGRTIGLRVCLADDHSQGRTFPCHPMSLPKTVRDVMGRHAPCCHVSSLQ